MAHNILEILNKCERRLTKKAKRSEVELQISGQAVFAQSETTQADEWQRLFIAIIQLHIDALEQAPNQLAFVTDSGQIRLIIENITDSLKQTDSYNKLINTYQQIDGISITQSSESIELIFVLDELNPDSQQVNKHILCADDNPDNRQIIQLLLEKMGHKVSTAENGKLALEATLEQEFDLIFLDIQMPVMDGIEALELIRSTACETPVIAFTAQVFDHEVAHLLELGFNAWLAKPIDRKKLDDILVEYLDNQTTSQSIEFDPVELAQMKHTYQQSLNQYIDDLQAANKEQDLAQIARLAHALKGSGGNFGFDDITLIAGQLEQSCNEAEGNRPSQPLNSLLDLLNTHKI